MSAGAAGARHRAPDDLVASLPPFAGGHELVGVGSEESRHRQWIDPLAGVDVSTHKLPDRGLVAVAGAVLRGQWRDSDGKADECEQCAHDNSSIEYAWRRARASSHFFVRPAQ